MKIAENPRKRPLRALVLPPLLVCLYSAVLFGLDVHLLSEFNRDGRADRVIARTHEASGWLLQRDAALQGFLDGGSPESVREYQQADARLGDCFDELARLVGDDPARSSRLAQLREQSRRLGDDAADRKGSGEIRKSLSAFLVAEEGDRDSRNETTRAQSWAVLRGCSWCAIPLGSLLVLSTRRNLIALCGTYEASIADMQARADRQERENLNLLSEAMKYYAIFTLDSEGRVSSWNADAERILGYRADDILARRPSCFSSQADAKRDALFRDLEWAALEGRVEDERWLTRKDGFRFKARVALVAIRDAKGVLCGYTNVIHEIGAEAA